MEAGWDPFTDGITHQKKEEQLQHLRAATMAVCLALAVVFVAAPMASAAPSVPAIAQSDCVNNTHMVQLATSADHFSTGDQSIKLDVWVAERYASDNTPCQVFQAVSRIRPCDGNCTFDIGREPIYYWKIALLSSGGSDLGTYIFSVPNSNPTWTPLGGGWWYFYGPYSGYLGCPVGQIHASAWVYESTSASGVQEPDTGQPPDGGVATGAAYQWTC